MTKEIKNAVIESTFLGISDRGIFTSFIDVNFGDGCSQGFGGYNLNYNNNDTIQQILNVVDVNNWEKLKGKNIRIVIADKKIVGIGHIIKDIWYYPEKK